MITVIKVWLTVDSVCIQTVDGREAKEYFADYTRLKYATTAQRENFSTDSLGIHWEELDEDLSFEGFFYDKIHKNELEKAFKSVPEVNISGVARRMGIPQSVMASYLCGAKKPSENRKKEIEKTLHQIGSELLAVKL